MEHTKTLTGPGGLTIELDRSQVFPDDPGNGTPAMVVLTKGRQTYRATYTCASNEGTVTSDGYHCEEYTLSDRQVNWLHEQEDSIEEFLNSK